mmetsp:Transcript_23437/g.58640  ORF Transcript_23437/g.58640 Transcript_23437/m.58640 type:complete len:346 (-) Transcript_23437:74-1111(-)|eukprot:CAMPEP_0177649242 /NCGR_PEP_ID=MMETSP0447-20121125/11272_1 /TAXON_ID=0 /ORGANISM="Stygamoeba regulata, Strain BSH-02190019" /LENGTH=345 /DNA_ID=CAMNT_0019151967 /DNA_START=218 /DNA_END=1255 /DNA_ORIENTATION=-
MGCSQGTQAQTTPECKDIDRQIAKDRRKAPELQLLLLGASESGKSTIAKHFLIINNQFNKPQQQFYKPVIIAEMLAQVKTLLAKATQYGVNVNEENAGRAERIAQEYGISQMPESVLDDMKALWFDPGVQQTFEMRHDKFYIPDCCEYLFANMDRIFAPDYLPTQEDCLRIRARTTGIIDIIMNVNDRVFHLLDVGGQRSERRKWIHCFSNVTSILYCIALDEYDMKLAEDPRVGRFAEAMKLFRDVANTSFIRQVPFIVFFNKRDLLEKKLAKEDKLKDYYAYTGGQDPEKAITFIKKMFLSVMPEDKTVYTHVTCALDKKNIHFVWNSVKDLMVKDNYAQVGM